MKKGLLLGTPGLDGQPRLYEQFMLNVAAKNMSRRVLPLRMPASIGLDYIRLMTQRGATSSIPPPAVIYIDTAHTYPETAMEAQAAWNALRPGGFMTGDDYTHYFPPVQQAINEWVMRQPAGTFVPPTEFASDWGKVQRMRRVRVLKDVCRRPSR